MTDTYEYDAFGNSVNKTGATPNNYLYRGEQYDPDLGLYYLRARYYNPATGRFLSVDPLADEGQRRYEYAAADPVDGIDPNGSEAYIETHCCPITSRRCGYPIGAGFLEPTRWVVVCPANLRRITGR